MANMESRVAKVRKLNSLVQSLCGLYSRVARRLSLDPSYVSRVARGERSSELVETALAQELNKVGREILDADLTQGAHP